MILLKIFYWMAIAIDLLFILGVAAGCKIYGPEDFLKVGLIVGLPSLYLVGSSVLFIRSVSVLWRCGALALVVLAPVAVVWYILYVAGGVSGMSR